MSAIFGVYTLAAMLFVNSLAGLWLLYERGRLMVEIDDLRDLVRKHRDQATKMGQELDNLLAQSKSLRELANRQDRIIAAVKSEGGGP